MLDVFALDPPPGREVSLSKAVIRKNAQLAEPGWMITLWLLSKLWRGNVIQHTWSCPHIESNLVAPAPEISAALAETEANVTEMATPVKSDLRNPVTLQLPVV